ncbi:MAG: sigma-E factor negative regulatory protein [Thiohalomonadaceae bacterium]
MKNHVDEQISALVDDELNRPELSLVLHELRDNADLQARWRRYQLISDTMRGHLVTTRASDLHRRVQQSLAQEPTILAPRRKTPWPALAKQAVGAAIAASVAVVAILVVQQESIETDGVTVTTAQLAKPSQPARTMAQLASITSKPPAISKSNAAQRERLNAYLVNHNEYSASSGMQGALPYVRIVSHGTAR